MVKSTEKVRVAAGTARPYVERALTDEEFRNSLRSAFLSAKEIYEGLVPPKGVSGLATRVAADEEIRDSLKRAVGDLMHAAERLQAREDEHELERTGHTFRNVLLILTGVVIGIFFNPFTGPKSRSWVKGQVSGGEFSYNGHDATETVTVDVD
jgi:hypothetical protein